MQQPVKTNVTPGHAHIPHGMAVVFTFSTANVLRFLLALNFDSN